MNCCLLKGCYFTRSDKNWKQNCSILKTNIYQDEVDRDIEENVQEAHQGRHHHGDDKPWGDNSQKGSLPIWANFNLISDET